MLRLRPFLTFLPLRKRLRGSTVSTQFVRNLDFFHVFYGQRPFKSRSAETNLFVWKYKFILSRKNLPYTRYCALGTIVYNPHSFRSHEQLLAA